MRKNLPLIAAVMVLFVLPAAASAMTLMSKGVKAGLIYSNAAGDDVTNSSAKLGMAGGAWLNFSLLDQIELQPELLYAMKGAKYDSEAGEATASVDYLEMPILASFSLPVASPWTPKLQAGPYFGFNTRASWSMDGESDVDVKDQTSQFDYGIVLGAGLAVQRYTFDARYAMGMKSTSDPAEGEAQDVKNRCFSFLFGISF